MENIWPAESEELRRIAISLDDMQNEVDRLWANMDKMQEDLLDNDAELGALFAEVEEMESACRGDTRPNALRAEVDEMRVLYNR